MLVFMAAIFNGMIGMAALFLDKPPNLFWASFTFGLTWATLVWYALKGAKK